MNIHRIMQKQGLVSEDFSVDLYRSQSGFSITAASCRITYLATGDTFECSDHLDQRANLRQCCREALSSVHGLEVRR